MQSLYLARIAGAAEALRLKRFARRQAIRAGFGVSALLFAFAAFVMFIGLTYEVLMLFVDPWLSALITFGLDALVIGILTMIAINNSADPIERDAIIIRHECLVELEPILTAATAISRAANLAFSIRKMLRKQNNGRAVSLAYIVSRLLL